MMTERNLTVARTRIADCLQRNARGQLVQRRDHLNLAELGLEDTALAERFVCAERNLGEIGFGDLVHLRYLDLTGNELTALPESVTKNRELIWLGLNFNQLTELPDTVSKLTKMRRLYLRGNRLEELPYWWDDLVELVELDLVENPLVHLPSSLGKLLHLSYVELTPSTLVADQRAAWKESGWSSLREYLIRSAEAEAMDMEVTQYVGKVVLVGPQENGKTCLQRALRGLPFAEGLDSTPGMRRERLHLSLEGKLVTTEERQRIAGPREDVIDLMLWDMGGQEHYQHLHQMFFTSAAVYVAVLMPRKGGGVQELDAWLDLVKRRTGGEAMVIVVSTSSRTKVADKSLTLTEMQAKHGAMVTAVLAVDSQDGTRIPELRKHLAAVARDPRSRCRHTWLPGWAACLNDFAQSSRPYLEWSEVATVCALHGITEVTMQRQIVRTGHFTGALLWREDVPAGENVVILNPDWLCRAVARLLDDTATRRKHGLVNKNHLHRIWSVPARDGAPGYEQETHEALIQLMEINELAYRPRVPGQPAGEGNLLLVTQMVEDMPRTDVEAKWREVGAGGGGETVRVIAFREPGSLNYAAVADIIYLLIFRLREFSIGRDDYEQAVHWQDGLLVSDDYGSAGRIEWLGDHLRITVRHRLGDGLMHSIISRIGQRGDSYWSARGLEKEELVPCDGNCACRAPNQGLVSIQECVEAVAEDIGKVRCLICRKYVEVAKLIAAVRTAPKSERELLNRMELLERRLAERITDDGNETRQKLEALVAENRELFAELKKHARMLSDGILDAYFHESNRGPRLFSISPVDSTWVETENWATLQMRVTVWCEASRRPVPSFLERKSLVGYSTAFKGEEVISVPREWLVGASRLLTWVSAALLTSGAIPQLGGDYSQQYKAIEKLRGALDRENTWHGAARKSLAKTAVEEASAWADYGKLLEPDLRLLNFLRDEFYKKDPKWGGLVQRTDDKHGRIWLYPKAAVIERSGAAERTDELLSQ